MPRRLLAFFVFSTLGCAATLEVPTGAQITCASDVECPDGYDCPTALGYCVTTGTLLPTVAVNFSQPGEGDIEVSLTGKFVIVLNLDAALPPAGLVTVVSADGSDVVALEIASTASANTFVATPKRRLFPLTDYVLTVAPGIAPGPSVFATSSTTPWIVHFKTTISSDTDAPAPVAKLIVSENGGGSASAFTVQWNPSPSNDAAGAILLRSSGAPVVDLPEAGRLYLVGQTIGTATVVYTGGLASWDDTPPDTAVVYYAVVSYDSALNYGPLSQPPHAALAGVPTWCPDETGSFTVVSADTGGAQIQVSDAPSAINGARYPAVPAVLNAPIPFAADSVFVPGVAAYFRAVGVNGDAVYLGPPVATTLPVPDLGFPLITSPLRVGAILASVNLQTWPAYEAQVDRNPASNTETWSQLEAFTTTLTAVFAQPGNYKFRGRPVVPGCAPIPYIEADEFNLIDRTDACRLSGPDASKCNNSGSVVFMSGGTTSSDRLEVVAGVQYYGGFSSDFYTRDLALYETKLTFPTNTIRIQSPAASTNTIIDGFHVINNGTAGPFDGALLVSDNASPTISHCIIERTSAGRAVQVLNSGPTFSRNTITGPSAVEVGGSSTSTLAVFDHNVITGTADGTGAFYCSGSAATINKNTIRHQLTSATGSSSAITVAQACTATINGNTLSATTATSATGVASAGIRFNWGLGTVTNNRISAGRGAQTTGIFVTTQTASGAPGTILIANNTILSGSGTTAQAWGTPRKGIILDAALTPVASRTVRITNNLVTGETDFDGFALDTSFTTLGSMQNNVVAGPAGSSFITSYRASATDQSVATFETNACALAPPTIGTGNSLLVASPTALFVSATGADGSIVTVEDDDWHLASSAPASIRDGGLYLTKSPTNCGGDACGTQANADCGAVSDDLDGVTRSAPYSVGAYAAP